MALAGALRQLTGWLARLWGHVRGLVLTLAVIGLYCLLEVVIVWACFGHW